MSKTSSSAESNATKERTVNAIQTVTLEVDDAIRLTVKDDGVGFDVSAADRVLSVGLPGMRDRMARLGGSVEILGDPGGTTLVASLPLERAQALAGGARSAA